MFNFHKRKQFTFRPADGGYRGLIVKYFAFVSAAENFKKTPHGADKRT